MSASQSDRVLQPGDVAPNVVLDAITRPGKVAVDDYRGRAPVLIGIFRGLHCPYCRRHIAAMAQLEPALREKGIGMLTVVNTPLERARLYFRYRPMPNLLAAADPGRDSHRAFGLPNLEFTQEETDWPRKVGMSQQMKATGMGQLVGEFLLDREGIIRWSFTEVPDGGKNLFGAPTPQELMSAA